jgi:hypothetical protein
LYFDAKTNQYWRKQSPQVDAYACTEDLSPYAFSFVLSCPDCVYIKSKQLVLEKEIVKPLEIDCEEVHIITDTNKIDLFTLEEESWIDVTPRFSNPNFAIKTKTIDIPPLFLTKWKTKERLLNTIKTYLTFA